MRMLWPIILVCCLLPSTVWAFHSTARRYIKKPNFAFQPELPKKHINQCNRRHRRRRSISTTTSTTTTQLWDSEPQEQDDATEDWRVFRARLVIQEQLERKRRLQLGTVDHEDDFLLPASWLTEGEEDTGTIKTMEASMPESLKVGTILVHSPRSDDIYGMDRPFLYKSVILVLEASKDFGTVGICLNRPTDLFLSDDSMATGPIRYGGDQYSITSNASSCAGQPKFFCMHTGLPGEPNVSSGNSQVRPGLYVSSIKQAKEMIEKGLAHSAEFVTFCGFCTWGPAELELEVNRGTWCEVNQVNAKELVSHLQSSSQSSVVQGDCDDTGRDEYAWWEQFMEANEQVDGIRNMVGRHHDTSFDNRMLRAWGQQHLVFDALPAFLRAGTNRGEESDQDGIVCEGDVLYAEATAFLFDNHELHKSVLLVLQDDDEFTVAILWNHPTIYQQWREEEGVPIRYGGNFDMLDVDTEMPPFCLHRFGPSIVPDSEPITATSSNGNSSSRNNPQASGETSRVWKCSLETAERAMEEHCQWLRPSDFMVIRGLLIWEKSASGEEDDHDGVEKQSNLERWILDGALHKLEDEEKIGTVWNTLLSQQVLTPLTMESNLDISNLAWRQAAETIDDDDDEYFELGREAVGIWTTALLLDEDPDTFPS